MLTQFVPATIINEYRTPVYSLFVALLIKFFSLDFVIIIQSILGLATLFLHFFILQSLKAKPLPTTLILLAIVGNPLIFQWERFIMTETIAIFFVTVFLFAWVHIQISKKSWYWAILIVSGCTLMLIRPAFVLFPTVALLATALTAKKGRILYVLSACIIAAIPVIYQIGNIRFHQYYGIQHVGEIAAFGKILRYDLTPKTSLSASYFYEPTIRFGTTLSEKSPFILIDSLDPTLYQNTQKMNELQQFAKQVIIDNLPLYIGKTLVLYPTTFFDQLDNELLIRVTHKPPLWLSLLQLFGTIMHASMLVVVLLTPVAVVEFLKRKTIVTKAVAIGSLLICMQTMLHAALIYEEWGRLNAIIIPMGTLILGYWSGRLWRGK